MKILWTSKVSAEFQVIRCAFPQNAHTRQLGKILLFCTLKINLLIHVLHVLLHFTEGIIFQLKEVFKALKFIKRVL